MANAQEMMMNTMFKWLGVEPDAAKAQIADIYTKVISFDARLKAIEAASAQQSELLAIIAKHMEISDNGIPSEKRSDLNGAVR